MGDIRSCSRVSRRFQELCTSHVHRKFKNEPVEIVVSSQGYLRITWRNEHVTHFRNHIGRLRICGNFLWSEQNLLDTFVRERCHENCTFELAICDGMDVIPYSEAVRGILHNLDTIYFTHVTQFGQYLSRFLNSCPNLTTLFVSRVHNLEMILTILRRTYSKLKHFHFDFIYNPYGEQQLKPEDLQSFLVQNIQIQSLEFTELSRFNGKASSEMVMKCIEIVADFASNLERFFVRIDGLHEEHFVRIYGYLKKMCDRSNFKTLELKVTEDLLTIHSNRLANLTQLKKIAVNSPSLLLFNERKFDQLIHLRSIIFYHRNIEAYSGETWHRRLLARPDDDIMEMEMDPDAYPGILPPQIEELTIRLYERIDEMEIMACLRIFTKQCKYLKKLTVLKHPSLQENINFSIDALNNDRNSLNNPAVLTIFHNFDGWRTNLNHELVKIQRVECSSIPCQENCMMA